MHLTSSPIDWYATRAAGIAAYLLLSAVVVLGVTMAGKVRLKRWPQFAVEDVHRAGGLLVGTFVVIHVLTIAIDAWLPFSLQSLVVPFLSSYRPLWVALGIVAAELLLALAVTNHYRRRLISYRFWRQAHYLNFAVWSLASLHGIGSGTDRNAPWLLALYTLAVAAVAAAIARRFLGGAPAAVAAAVGAVALVVGLALGPFRVQPSPVNAGSFHGKLTGYFERNRIDPGTQMIALVGVGHARQHVLIRADLLIDSSKLRAGSFQMEYMPTGLVCTGSAFNVADFGFDARCRTRTGLRRVVHVQWKPSNVAELKDGVITSRPETTTT